MIEPISDLVSRLSSDNFQLVRNMTSSTSVVALYAVDMSQRECYPMLGVGTW